MKTQNYVKCIQLLSLQIYVYPCKTIYNNTNEKRFDALNYEWKVKECFQKKKAKTSHGFNERWIRGEKMKEFVGLKAKTHSYFTDDRESKNSKGANEFLIKRKYKKCLEATQLKNEIILRNDKKWYKTLTENQ